MEQVELEKLKFAVQIRISEELAREVDVKFFTDTFLDDVIMQMRSYVWGEPGAVEEINILYPADWWQAIKDRFFPSWLKLMYPVKYERYHYEVKAVYPNFVPKLRKEAHRMLIIP